MYSGQGISAYMYKTDMIQSLAKKVTDKRAVELVSKRIEERVVYAQRIVIEGKLKALSSMGSSQNTVAQKEVVSLAKSSIAQLKDPGAKDYFTKKLSETENRLYYDAIYRAIKIGGNNPNDYDIDYIKKQLALVKEIKTKEALNKMFSPLSEQYYAKSLESRLLAVNITNEEDDILLAKKLLSQVSSSKTAFFLQQINTADNTVRFKEVTKRMNYADKLETYDIYRMKKAMLGVTDYRMKEELNKRIVETESRLKIKDAYKHVETVEKSKLYTDLQRAKTEVSRLNTSNDKTYLQNKLNALSKIIQPTK